MNMETKNPMEVNPIDLQKAMETMEEITTPKVVTPDLEKEEYDGPGIVVTKEEIEVSNAPKPANVVNGIDPESRDNFQRTMQSLDEEIAREKEKLERMTAEGVIPVQKDIPELVKERNDEITILLDKVGMGTVTFSDEEREKITKSKVIKIKEIQSLDIPTKIKKLPNNKNLGDIIKKTISYNTTSIVLPHSGYTAVVKGCSPYEIMSLGIPGQSPVERNTTRWSLIHSKIVTTSIGDLSYNDFLLKTSYLDDAVFIYGIVCATFLDQDVIQVPCNNDNCGTDEDITMIDVSYNVKSLLRADRLNDVTIDTITNIIDNANNRESALRVHSEAEVNTAKSIELPDSGVIVNIKSRNVYDFINNMLADLRERSDPKYRDVSYLSSMVNSLYIEDPADGEYFEVTEVVDIIDVLYTLSGRDILTISHLASENTNLGFQFGVDDVRCRKCGAYEEYRDIDLDWLLFMLNQQAMLLTVE